MRPDDSTGRGGHLYPEGSLPLDIGAFREPPPVYRGAPFWAWNARLDQARLLRQIEWFQAMGMGGFFMHPRTGLDTEYLGREFMDCVAACADKAATLGMRAWLYDEDRWPSGYAGGLITQDPACRERYLLLTTRPYGATPPEVKLPMESPLARNERGRLLARYQVKLDAGYLINYRRLSDHEPTPAAAVVWHAYLEVRTPCEGWNHATLGDVLNPETARRFIEVTHERYATTLGRYFTSTVPGIFTDEAHFMHMERLSRAMDERDVCLPFTDDLPDTYQRAYDDDLLDRLPEVVWDLAGNAPSVTRYRFHDHLCDRLVNGFLKPIGAWCEKRGIALTGHLAEESSLEAQVAMNGDIMRGYAHMQIPGMDVVADGIELNTAKQSQSVVRQLGKAAMTSELYGATGWDYSFAEFKAQGDWQAALGVTLRVHHLAWYSMAGEAKHDYPGSIFYQQPWWREFKTVEDHFARLNTLMTRGRPLVHVGIIHPVESFWLCYGPADTSGAECAARERQFRELTEWLSYGLIDFDFVSESLLPGLWREPSKPDKLRVGRMEYDVILVPPLRTVRKTTLERLERFVDAGGRLIFLDEAPSLVEARPSLQPARLQRRCRRLPMERDAILKALASYHLFDAQGPAGALPSALLCQMREDQGQRTLFICNTDRKQARERIRFRFPGAWRVTQWDTLGGETHALPVSRDGDTTVLEWSFPAHGHLLVTLDPASAMTPEAPSVRRLARAVFDVPMPDHIPVTLSEPNVLPLELARWRWNDEAWQPREETLRVEDAIRRRLGLPLRRSSNAQPWCERGPTPVLGRLTIEFDIVCGRRVEAPMLALETPSRWRLVLDGAPLAIADAGWWVDEAIRTISLSPLMVGVHRLSLQTDFTRTSAIEWVYLLGDFSVPSTALDAALAAPVTALRWGDWTTQGLPFYTGNVTYRLPLHLSRPETLQVRFPAFANPAVRVAVDERDAELVAFAPFECLLGEVPVGHRELRLTAFGTRFNAFGCLHHPPSEKRGVNPGDWHTTGKQWDYARHVSPKGILQAPVIERVF